jgi:hypothetical protein
MSFDKSDFDDLARQRAAERTTSRLPQLLSIAAAAPKMDALTRDANWDHYLGYLTGIREKLETARAQAQERMGSPSLVNQDEIMQQKLIMLINDAQIQAIDLAIGLPKALLESAKSAMALVEKFEEDRKKREAA